MNLAHRAPNGSRLAVLEADPRLIDPNRELMDRPQAWIEKLSELRAQGRPCAMVVVTGVRGSGPREAGARMIVALGEPANRRRIGASGSRAASVVARTASAKAHPAKAELVFGTVGGGNLELLAIAHCAELLKLGSAVSESVAYPLSEKVGQCCGGEVTLFFETFPWTRRRIAIFGAGHVAQAIGGLARYLSADLVLIDPREESEILPQLPLERPYELVCVDNPEQELDELPIDTLVLVMTHNHALDLEIVARAIKLEFPYLGLIGSERKWQRFRRRLEQRGFATDEIARVRCPIGVSKHSKEPAAIAISVAAELLEVMQTSLAIHPQRRASS
jgi:xanthine dehydrogenase accessory factor